MQVPELLENARSVVEQLGAKIVYAEPVTSGQTTVVPVARVVCGFGGGSGRGRREQGEGGGGGGGFRIHPAGYIDITAAWTRFVPVYENRKIAAAMLAGMWIGYVAGRLRRRR